MKPLLQIQDLRVSFPGHPPVLKGISLEITAGEILALTGESGSGKSMTALAVMGLLPDRATATGQITLEDTTLTDLSEKQLCQMRGRDVGLIFQEPMTALNPLQTIGQQVSETLRLHENLPRGEAEARAREILTRVGLPPDRVPLGRYPHELSGGQRQRVVIAMAVALRPKLLIADEPTTALDVTTQAQILDLLVELTRDFGMGLLMITHDLAVVAQMADRIAVMRYGEILETAPTDRLFAQTQHPYTRALLAAAGHQAVLAEVTQHPPLLQVENVSCDYPMPRPHLFAAKPKFRAVRDVSLTINKGERVGLVGESGCGKSTLTRAILGLEPTAQGQITLDGAPVFTHGHANLETRRKIQVVFQDPYSSFNPRHRVSRLISEPFHLLPDPPRGDQRVQAIAEALTAVGLKPSDGDKYIHAFSGGQRQRIAIARALIIRPEIIVFDEAVSALDVQVRAQILDLMADLSRDYGLTYLFISHDLSVVRSITDRVLVMRAGEIVEQGPTQQIFDTPQHSYTKTLINAAPVLPQVAQEESP